MSERELFNALDDINLHFAIAIDTLNLIAHNETDRMVGNGLGGVALLLGILNDRLGEWLDQYRARMKE